jgi:hypothetical protein
VRQAFAADLHSCFTPSYGHAVVFRFTWAPRDILSEAAHRRLGFDNFADQTDKLATALVVSPSLPAI